MKAKMWVSVFFVACLLLAGGAAMAVSTQQVTYSFWCGQNPGGPESGCAWYDDKVAVIIEAETAADRDTAAMADFVQFFHDLHTAFEQQTGLTSLPLSTGWNGRIVCQVPIDNCGAGGLANHGSTGMSVGAGLFNIQYNLYFTKPNTYHQVFFYETNRNYWPGDLFNPPIDWAVDNDPVNYGWWTVGMNNAQAYTMCHYLGCDLEYYGQDLAQWRSGQLSALEGCIEGRYTWDSGWTHKYLAWAPTRTLNSLESGLIIYSYENWGGFDFLDRFYQWLQSPEILDVADRLDYPQYRDNVYKIWSMAADRDLRNFFENTLQWPLSDAAKSWVSGKSVVIGSPGPAQSPQPADGMNVVNRVRLIWDGHFDADSYDVYLGTTPTPGASELQGNQIETSYNPGPLTPNTTYYWRVDSINSAGTATGTVWSFTTGADVEGQTVNVTPINWGIGCEDTMTGTGFIMYSQENVYTRFTGLAANNADHLVAVNYTYDGWGYCTNTDNTGWLPFTPQSTDVLLAEIDFDAPSTTSLEGVYEIYQGMVKGYASGDLAYFADQWNGSYNSGEFDATGTYFVRNSGTAVWLPRFAKNARPVAGTPDVPTSGAQLSWQAGDGAVSHDVYFGTSETLTTADFKGNQTSTTYDPGMLNEGITYYWRIDEVNASGTTVGDVWYFETASGLTFVNVTTGNTEAVNGTTPWYTADQNGQPRWRDRDAEYGVFTADECWTAGQDYLLLKTTITGLTPGATYNVYLDFASIGSWSILGGLSQSTLEGFSAVNRTIGADAYIGADDASGRVVDTGNDTSGGHSIYRALLGTIAADGNGQIAVYVDDPDNVGVVDTYRAWYDGVAYKIVSDAEPPTPNPATFATAPYATGTDSITMVATAGSDASGPVEYLFTETSGNPGGTSSGWQTSASYTDTGLSPDTQYAYTVTLRDSLGNTGTASSPASATTDPAQQTSMYVQAIDLSVISAGGPNRKGVATVTIYDEQGQPLSGATVYGTFTGSYNETGSAVTDANGQAVMTTIGKAKDPAFTFTVDNVTASGYTYDPASNLETSDSY